VQECGALQCCREDSGRKYSVSVLYTMCLLYPYPSHNCLFITCLQCWRFLVLACLGLMLSVCTSRFHTMCLYTSDFVPNSTSLHIQDLTIDKVCANVALYCVGMCRAHGLGLYWKIPYYMCVHYSFCPSTISLPIYSRTTCQPNGGGRVAML
jgi:hypothetical protein